MASNIVIGQIGLVSECSRATLGLEHKLGTMLNHGQKIILGGSTFGLLLCATLLYDQLIKP